MLTGQLNVFTTNITTETRVYKLNATGDLRDQTEPPVNVPVPAPLALLGIGLAGLALHFQGAGQEDRQGVIKGMS